MSDQKQNQEDDDLTQPSQEMIKWIDKMNKIQLYISRDILL